MIRALLSWGLGSQLYRNFINMMRAVDPATT